MDKISSGNCRADCYRPELIGNNSTFSTWRRMQAIIAFILRFTLYRSSLSIYPDPALLCMRIFHTEQLKHWSVSSVIETTRPFAVSPQGINTLRQIWYRLNARIRKVLPLMEKLSPQHLGTQS